MTAVPPGATAGGGARWVAAGGVAWVGAVAGAAHAPLPGPALAATGVGLLLVAAAVRGRRARPRGDGWGRWLAVAAALAGVGSLALAAGHRAEVAFDPPAPGPFAGEVTLVADPRPVPGGIRVDVATAGRRLELVATGAGAGRLRPLLAGERVVVTGSVAAAGGPGLRTRHVTGRLRATAVRPGRAADPLPAVGNAVHRTLGRGAAPLSEAEAALLAGLVVGDDRHLPPTVLDRLRAGGLGHLTAVSGQNVAFLLALAGPGLRRLGPAARLAAVVALLVVFATVTRAEPSVLRATAMAAVAAGGTAVGRPVAGLRALGAAVAGLVLVDPFLVGSLGFQLSVAASLGIVVGAGPLAAALPLPAAVALPVAVTLAAQVAVAPLLAVAGIPSPVAGLVANPLAGPAAGATMAWGLTGGLVAGVVPALAPLVHLPTRALLGVVTGAGALADRLPLGVLDGAAVAVLAATVAAAAVLGRWPRRAVAALAVGAAALAALPAPTPSPGRSVLGPGAELVVGSRGRILVVDGRADPARVLGALRRAGVDRVGVVVVRSDAVAATATASAVRWRWPSARVVGPADVPGVRQVRHGDLVACLVARPGAAVAVAVRPEGGPRGGRDPTAGRCGPVG